MYPPLLLPHGTTLHTLQHRPRKARPLSHFKMRKATSSAAGLMAVLAAVAPLASAFTCTWRGGDYSWFTYYEEIPRDCCSKLRVWMCLATYCLSVRPSVCPLVCLSVCLPIA